MPENTQNTDMNSIFQSILDSLKEQNECMERAKKCIDEILLQRQDAE